MNGPQHRRAWFSKPASTEDQTARGRDNDGDADDNGGAAVKSAPAPAVNLSDQKIGLAINVSAYAVPPVV
jgi:hypothetical protein